MLLFAFLRGVLFIQCHSADEKGVSCPAKVELELELIQTQMAQKPMLRVKVGMRVRCANKASAQ